MNKVILVVALIAVGLSGFNTYLLLQVTDAIQNAAKDIAPVNKQLEKLQPVLKKLADQPDASPAELPKQPAEDKAGEPKVKPPLPPGALPKEQ